MLKGITRDDVLLVLTVSLAIILSGLFLGSMLIYASNQPYHKTHSIVGAPWDWYPDQQENPPND